MNRHIWLRHLHEICRSACKHISGWVRSSSEILRSNRSWLALVLILAVVGVLIWRLIASWDWLSADLWNWLQGQPDSVESGSTTVRNLGLVLAGAVALPLAIWRSWVAQRQADTALQDLLNRRYQQGAEMLGSTVLSVRLGGIYALERLAREHPDQYHIPIMQLLCAFVRHPSAGDRSESAQVPSRTATHRPRIDVQNAVMSISACHARQGRLKAEASFRLDLRGATLPGADLFEVQLGEANLLDANLSETGLIGANLASAVLNRASLAGAQLSHADLSGARLERADLSQARLNGANLAQAGLYNAILLGAHLTSANLAEAHLASTNLAGASFDQSDLTRARLQYSNLAEARLYQADLTGAMLSQTNLSGAALGGATLLDANLSSAIVSGANLGPLAMEIHKDNEEPYRKTIRTKITQSQLDVCRADPASPPMLDGAFDAETGKPLIWRGKPLHSQT